MLRQTFGELAEFTKCLTQHQGRDSSNAISIEDTLTGRHALRLLLYAWKQLLLNIFKIVLRQT